MTDGTTGLQRAQMQARAWVRRAAQEGNPVEIAAAARAYRSSANLALLADLWRLMLDATGTACRHMWGHLRAQAGAQKGTP